MPAADHHGARHAAQTIPGIPRDAHGPVFREPWEAHAFAIALALHDGGVFTWSEWAATLGDEIKKAQAAGDPDTGETYYRHWLVTLERIVAEKQVTTAEALARTCAAWEHAAHRTPHGTPIELRADDFVAEHRAAGPARRGTRRVHDDS
jgi:nitrile hydratase accessory protein